MLDLDTHRRKWTLIINGLDGKQGESEHETRAIVRRFATEKLKLAGADSHPFGACHRLAQKDNAGIIIRFTDLTDKNSWLTHAKNLKNTNSNVSISPDMPPCLRPLKTDILNIRKDLPPAQKQLGQVRYLPSWPYINLKIRGQATMNPRIKKETILAKYLSEQ